MTDKAKIRSAILAGRFIEADELIDKQELSAKYYPVAEINCEYIKGDPRKARKMLEAMNDERLALIHTTQQLQKEKIETLKECFTDTIWMAIRYAHGRNTYAPSMVRDAVKKFKLIFPDWQPGKDTTINPPEDSDIGGMTFRTDYLDDLFTEQ